jgi:phthalate 4,5-dioxygenase
MLTREENELLCRVGTGTPMGKLIRRFWIPAAASEELVAKGKPRRIRLLGSEYVLFRDSTGAVGMLDEACPHRGVSLMLARNEDCGLRCLYHGWKFDVSGNVLETPTEPENSTFKDRVTAKSYPVYEAGGVIWAYLGDREHVPSRMNFDFTALPDQNRMVIKLHLGCNWVQAVEGVIDSAHSNFLHADTFVPTASVGVSTWGDGLKVDRPSNDTRPRLETHDMEYGFRAAALRKPIVDPETMQYVRVTEFIAPFYSMFPAPHGYGNMQAFVPIDDENTMLYFVKYNYTGPMDEAERERHYQWSKARPGVHVDAEYRSKRTRENDWLQDRAAMESGRSFSGIDGVQIEDAVVQESMGPLYDRTQEHLGASDGAVIRMRRMMIAAARSYSDTGNAPFALDRTPDYAAIAALECMVPLETDWRIVPGSSPAPALA